MPKPSAIEILDRVISKLTEVRDEIQEIELAVEDELYMFQDYQLALIGFIELLDEIKQRKKSK